MLVPKFQAFAAAVPLLSIWTAHGSQLRGQSDDTSPTFLASSWPLLPDWSLDDLAEFLDRNDSDDAIPRNFMLATNGYDALYLSNFHDNTVAARGRIFMVNSDEATVVAGSNFLEPPGFEVDTGVSCTSDSTVTSIRGETSLIERENATMTMNGGSNIFGVKGQFQSSSTFSSVSERSSSEESITQFLSMECGTHNVRILPGREGPLLSSHFVSRLMDAVDGKIKASQIVHEFGTHHLQSAQFGARLLWSTTHTREQHRILEQNTDALSTGMDLAFQQIELGIQGSNTRSEELINEFLEQSTVQSMVTIGTRLPGGSSMDEIMSNWNQLLDNSESTVPISNLRYQSLPDLLSSAHMLENINLVLKSTSPSLDEARELHQTDLQTLIRDLGAALSDHCENVAGRDARVCMDPSADPKDDRYLLAWGERHNQGLDNGNTESPLSGLMPFFELRHTWPILTTEVMPTEVSLRFIDGGTQCAQQVRMRVSDGPTDHFTTVTSLWQGNEERPSDNSGCHIQIPYGTRITRLQYHIDSGLVGLRLFDRQGNRIGSCGRFNGGSTETFDALGDEWFHAFQERHSPGRTANGNRCLGRLNVRFAKPGALVSG